MQPRHPLLAAPAPRARPSQPGSACASLGADESRARPAHRAARRRWPGSGQASPSHPRDRLGIEPAEVARRLRGEPAPAHHRLGPALLQRRIVEIGIRPRRQHFEGERRRLGEIARDDADGAGLEPGQQPLQPFDVHRFVEAVGDGLADQADGRGSRARRPGSRRRRSGRERPRAIRSSASMRTSCGGTFRPPRKRGSASATPATQRQRVMNIGASSSAWISNGLTLRRTQVARHLAELEAVGGGQREHDIVLGRRRLQLEVELAAEALAQRQPPGAVDAAAVRANG